MPNDGMLAIGRWSWMVAAGRLATITRFTGSTDSGAGAAPNVQVMRAPVTTAGFPMPLPSTRRRLERTSRPPPERADPHGGTGNNDCPVERPLSVR